MLTIFTSVVESMLTIWHLLLQLEQQIEKSEKTSSTQKHSAATLKMQRDELEEDNRRMQESLRIKEETLSNAMLRLTAIEADSRRVRH